MRETWYMLEDGSVADPAEVAPDKDGLLRHSGGSAVAMRDGVPHSVGVDPEEERARAAKPSPKRPAAPKTAEMKPAAPKRGYKTR